jgi:Protein of unknown function (DUF3108)
MGAMRHSIALALLLAGFATGAALAAEPGIARYTAEYEVETDGHRVANAEFRVAENADGYVFSSSARARGVLRLVRPDPAVDRSEFSLVDDRIVPSMFRYEDGSRKGEDNFSVVFDSAASEVRVNSAAGTQTLPLEAGLLDRGAVQVALMRDLSACRLPGPYRYVDDDGIGEYRFERVDDLAAETGIGTLDTIRFSQQREGSSRKTIFWLAPELAFLPVRIDQFRNGELRTSFTLDEVEGLERKPAACSSFR